eukprot:1632855-Alexandrium_andersonii.AAC.1
MARSRHSDTFGSIQAVLLVALSRLDHEGALELSLLPSDEEEQISGVTLDHQIWVKASLLEEGSH